LAVPGSPGTEKLIAEGAEIFDSSKADIDELAQSILSVNEVIEE
jgi:predicted Rossmann fold nucleotide-binding protein DprA/Smf involved in DNA uptake